MPRATSRRGPAREPGFLDELFAEDMLGDDLEDWLAESALMKRTFRQCAVIAGPDRAPLPGREEDRPAGHDLDRSRLRRAAQARARPRAAAGRAGGCGNGTPRREAPRHDADAHPGANHPQAARPGFSLERVRHAGDRPRARLSATMRTRFWPRRKRRFSTRLWRDGIASRTNRQRTRSSSPGSSALLDLTGAMYLPDDDVLLVADLHLEKGSSFARRGMMLPPYDTRETLLALCEAVVRASTRGPVVALGDSFHDIGGPGPARRRGARDARATCRPGATGSGSPATTTASCPTASAARWSTEMTLGLARPCATSRRPGEQAEIAGHLHPVGKVVMRGRADAAALLPHRRRALRHAGASAPMRAG